MHGFSFRQISGPRLTEKDTPRFSSINQYDNQGGEAVGIVVDILNNRGETILTSPTFNTFQAADAHVEPMLLRFD